MLRGAAAGLASDDEDEAGASPSAGPPEGTAPSQGTPGGSGGRLKRHREGDAGASNGGLQDDADGPDGLAGASGVRDPALKTLLRSLLSVWGMPRRTRPEVHRRSPCQVPVRQL